MARPRTEDFDEVMITKLAQRIGYLLGAIEHILASGEATDRIKLYCDLAIQGEKQADKEFEEFVLRL